MGDAVVSAQLYTPNLAVGFICLPTTKQSNAALQLRRAISIQAEGKKLLEKHAIAPSAARLCSASLLMLRTVLH
jgi:hypothetical protein